MRLVHSYTNVTTELFSWNTCGDCEWSPPDVQMAASIRTLCSNYSFVYKTICSSSLLSLWTDMRTKLLLFYKGYIQSIVFDTTQWSDKIDKEEYNRVRLKVKMATCEITLWQWSEVCGTFTICGKWNINESQVHLIIPNIRLCCGQFVCFRAGSCLF